MHIRFSLCRGVGVVEEGAGEELGQIAGILVHPDTGRVEGFFVRTAGLFAGGDLFLSPLDIARWGTAVSIRSHDVLSSPGDRVRLVPLLGDPRRVLGQRMRTESGRSLGRCADIQFDTERWRVEWLFPRKLLWWGTPLPITEVLEVRPEAIIVRDTSVGAKEPAAEKHRVLEDVQAIAETGVPQPTTRSSR